MAAFKQVYSIVIIFAHLFLVRSFFECHTARPAVCILHVASQDIHGDNEGVRVNKVFSATHSRRQADKLIDEGRVTVNGVSVTAGYRVIPGDVVRLDGKIYARWENVSLHQALAEQHEYIKFWKPTGVLCTTDQRIENNIIDALQINGNSFNQRLFPVGRLDKDTSGLILLTSDGRLPNTVLKGSANKSKTYVVTVDQRVSPEHVRLWSEGVVITTEYVSDGKRKTVKGKTRPAVVAASGTQVEITITEGRNRQVRKMMGALGYRVETLTRIDFMGITLEGLEGPGHWKRLNENEMDMITQSLNS